MAFGASIIEKHFIVSREDTTADSFFSATPNELKEIVVGTKMVHESIGEVSYPIVAKKAQRSLIAISDISKGEPLLENKNFRSIRPGGGIEPKYIENVVNRKAVENIARGTLLSWELLGEQLK